MEPKFQTSFIPKTPMSGSATPQFSVGISFSIMGILSKVSLLIALVASGFLFGYKGYIENQVKDSQAKLVQAKEAFSLDDNQKIILASNQIKTVRTLLSNHIVVTPLFDMLQKNVLPTVKLTSFSFTQDVSGVITVNMEGEAKSYTALAQQASILSTLTYFKSVDFTDVALTDAGTIQVKLKVELDKDVLLYSKKLQELSVHNDTSIL